MAIWKVYETNKNVWNYMFNIDAKGIQKTGRITPIFPCIRPITSIKKGLYDNLESMKVLSSTPQTIGTTILLTIPAIISTMTLYNPMLYI